MSDAGIKADRAMLPGVVPGAAAETDGSPPSSLAVASGWSFFDTPVGACALAWNEALTVTGCYLPEPSADTLRARMQRRFPGLPEADLPTPLLIVIERLRAALQGAPDTLEDVPLDYGDTPPFNQRVYVEARRIPPGRIVHYGDIAKALGEPGASRAVGQALGHNPFAPIVPCHRVLAAGWRSGGFSASGGVATKLKMLELEKARFGDQDGLF